MTGVLEWLDVAGTGIGAAVGALIALGGVIGALGRLSQLSRVRRRISTAAVLAKDAHPDLVDSFEKLQKEESARYLALVQGRIGYGTVGIAVLTSVTILSGVFILFATLTAGSGTDTWDWDGVTGVAVLFTLPGMGAGVWALDLASARHNNFLQAYATHTGTAKEEPPKGPRVVWLLVAVASSLAFVWIGGFLLGRYITDTGRELLEGDNPWTLLGLRGAVMATLILAVTSFRLLLPELPRPGGTLSAAKTGDQDPTEELAVRDDPTAEGPPTPPAN